MTADTLRHIDRLIQQRSVSATTLEPFKKLLELMVGLNPEIPNISIEEMQLKVKHDQGFPIFTREELPLDFETAAGLVMKFFECLKNQDREDTPGLENAFEKSVTEPDWTMRLFRAVLRQDEQTLKSLGKGVGIDAETLFFWDKPP